MHNSHTGRMLTAVREPLIIARGPGRPAYHYLDENYERSSDRHVLLLLLSSGFPV